MSVLKLLSSSIIVRRNGIGYMGLLSKRTDVWEEFESERFVIRLLSDSIGERCPN